MGELENVNAVIQKSLAETNPKLRKKILQQENFNRWHEIFHPFDEKIIPVKLQGETLIVASNDSAIMDTLKFCAEKFVKLINEKISPDLPIVSKLKLGKSFNAPQVVKKVPAKKQTAEIEVTLTPKEIADCEKKVAAIADENCRKVLLETALSYAKSQKLKLQRGWHKCKLCNLLCPPNEIICNICAVTERDRMNKAIRKIFCTAPETPFREIQQKMIRQFPHLECTLEKIESARMDLILQQASKVPYGDTNSDAAIFLVRLIRQLPREKLTEAIINRTLKEFKFNLADLPPFPKYEFSKPVARSIKKISK